MVRRHYYRHRRTVITQDVVLFAGCSVVYFQTDCDYGETFKMLRADFDVSVCAPTVRCDIQLGTLERSTGDATDLEKAQFEICAHKYVDLSDGGHGVSLMNDCKYGHRVKGSRISLNLLRSPIYPDKTADRRRHNFTYALFFHAGECGVDSLAHSYALNKPIYQADGCVDIGSVAYTDNRSVVVETIKRAYDGKGVVIRLYESAGQSAVCKLHTLFDFSRSTETDLLENEMNDIDLDNLKFTPFEIKTIKLF